MKASIAAVVLLAAGIVSCQVDEKERSKLSDVQKEMAKNELVKVSREDIFTAAQKQSVMIGEALRNQSFSKNDIDSLEEAYTVTIRFYSVEDLQNKVTEEGGKDPKEDAVFAAYLNQFQNGGLLEDNVQYIRNDNQLAYDFPVKSDSVAGLWHVLVNRKDIILNELN